MNTKLKPALIGGVVLGVLSVIPFVSAANLCCCLWAILGGILASYLYIKNSPTPATPGDGAMLGALAGVIGGAISLVLGIPIAMAMGPTMRNLMITLLENADRSQRRRHRSANHSISDWRCSALHFCDHRRPSRRVDFRKAQRW
jgi:hypothetical protein